MNQFSSLFEILAAANLAYAGIESVREVIINTLTDFYTPNDLEEKKRTVDEKSEIVLRELESGAFGIGLKSHAKRVKKRFDDNQAKLQKLHDVFMRKQGFKPVFFVTFLFCFSNLILIGFEQYFTTYSSVIAEQWFLYYGLYICVLFFEKPKMLFSWVIKHWVIFILFFLFLFLAFGYSFCTFSLVNFSHIEKLIMTLSLIIAVSPFFLEYFFVRKYAINRAKQLEKSTTETSEKLDEILETVKGEFPTLSVN